MENLNVNIRIAEAKDLIKNTKIASKDYKGSLDYSLETDFIEDNLKGFIYSKDGYRYSDDIITVSFKYSAMLEVEGIEEYAKNEIEEIERIKCKIKECESKEEKKELRNKLEEVKEQLEIVKENKVKEIIKSEYKKVEEEHFERFNYERDLLIKYAEETKLNRDIYVSKLKNEFLQSNNEQYSELISLKRKRSAIQRHNSKVKRSGEGDIKEFIIQDQIRIGELQKKFTKEFNEYKSKNEECQKLIEIHETAKNALKNEKSALKKELKFKKEEIKSKYYKSTEQLRIMLYERGFDLIFKNDDNTETVKHFVRYKRSSGSAREGKCLFVNEEYYNDLINWSFAGLNIEGKQDLAGVEAYISLPLSSSIGRFKLKPENILLVKDMYSVFKDKVMATRYIDGRLITKEEMATIKNNIFDGEALLDISIFKSCEINKIPTDLSEKATLQIRNKFYKGQGINCKIQEFYKEYFKGEYETATIKDMYGKEMLAKDVLLITTPSSLKYMKCGGSYEEWKMVMSENWAICKYEKPQHHFDGMVQTHYQLINGFPINKEEMREFLNDTIEYIKALKNDDNVFKYHVNIKNELGEDFEIDNTDKMIKALLTWNDDFIKTKLCWDYRDDIVDSYIKNVRKGHVLVNGNYSVVANNVVEMLYHSVGMLEESEFKKNEKVVKRLIIKDKPDIKLIGYEAISNKFNDLEEFMAVRSPQPTMSNVGVYKNIKSDNNLYYAELSKYFNIKSKEILFTNSINVNKMEKFSSEDFDIDAEMISNNPTLVKNANEIQKFLVNNDMTDKTPDPKERTLRNLAIIDIKCSENKIGEIINTVQSLNSIYWNQVHINNNPRIKDKHKTQEWLDDLYKDICTLATLSCIEIDRCKKISPVDTNKELKIIRDKNYTEGYKPQFLKYCNEFKIKSKDNKKPNYKKFKCGMQFLEDILTKEIKKRPNGEYIKLSDIIIETKKEANRNTVNKVMESLNSYIANINRVYMDNIIPRDKVDNVVRLLEERCANNKDIINKLQDEKVIKTIIKRCERYEGYKKDIKKNNNLIKKAEDENLIEQLKKENKRIEGLMEKVSDYKHYRRIIKLIFMINKSTLMKCFYNKSVENKITPNILLYGVEIELPF